MLVLLHSRQAASLQFSLLTFHVSSTIIPSHHYQLSPHAVFCLMISISLSTLLLHLKIKPLIYFVCRVRY